MAIGRFDSVGRLIFTLTLVFCPCLAEAEKGFAGIWQTSFGRMRLMADQKSGVKGVYELGGRSTISGQVKEKRFTFKYQEAAVGGEGWFELLEGGDAFKGQWRERGQGEWRDWSGHRIAPNGNKVWLVSLEARWEGRLQDKEFAFGDMLKSFFDRTDNVEVRRRFFTDSTSLKRWLEEVAYLAEPSVVSVASHGETDGLKVDGKTIAATEVADGLEFASNLRALHFSSCLVMKNQFGKEVFTALSKRGLRAPVSGYKNTIDWALSALFEMTYFDLLLARGMPPAKASRVALSLFPLAGSSAIKGVPLEPGGFKIYSP